MKELMKKGVVDDSFSNEQSENKIKKTILLTVALTRIV